MFSIDDRTGNVVTTVTLFLVAAAILYLARGVFFILLLSLLFAYLLEPAVSFVQEHSYLSRMNRTVAIAQVYLIGALVLVSLGYGFGPHLVAQMKNLNAAVPEILQDLSSGRAPADLGTKHGLNLGEQQRIYNWVAKNHSVLVRGFERGAAFAGYVAERVVWLLAVPILAVFILRDGRGLAGGLVRVAARDGKQEMMERVLRQVDAMLANYVRAQLALAGLSFVFYSVSMLLLRFPYAMALGFLGGTLEFLPALGWITAAALILTIGFLTHAHWIWMSVLLVIWRLIQDYVNSPRIMGKTLELEPLTVLIALMVGGQVGGIAGLYLSVPAVAVMRIVWLGLTEDRSAALVAVDRGSSTAAGHG